MNRDKCSADFLRVFALLRLHKAAVLWVFALLGGLAPAMAFGATATTTTLAISAGGAGVGSVAPQTPTVLTATVTGGGLAVHPGQITFCDTTAGTCLGAGRLGVAQVKSNGTAALTLRLGVGPHTLTALFAGTTTYSKSVSSAVPLTVTGAAATTSALTFSGVQGSYSLSSKVTSTASLGRPITGTVTFTDTSNSNATVATAPLAAGAPVNSLSLGSSNPIGLAEQIIATGDFNNDGLPDVITVNSTLSVFLNTGGGNFTRKSVLTLGNATGLTAPVVGDFNGDGNLDIAIAGATGGNNNATEIFILLGNGDGTFNVSAPIVPATPSGFLNGFQYAQVGDFNGDGNLDISISTEGLGGTNGSVFGFYVLLGNGDGTFNTGSLMMLPTSFALAYVAADFDGDGKTDYAYADYYKNTASVLLSNGDGTFRNGGTYAVGNQPVTLDAADFDNDGRIDLVALASATGQTAFLKGVGDGTFTASVSNLKGPAATGISSEVVAVGDFNGDGILDLVSSGENVNNLVQVLQGNGDGTFTTQPAVKSTTATYGAYGLVAGDFNGDGIVDVAGVNPGSSNFTVLLSQITATATATATGVSVAGSGTHTVTAGYPGDASYGGSTSNGVALNVAATPTRLSLAIFPRTGPYGRSPTLVATLAPYSNSVTNTNGETVTFLKDGNAVGTGVLANGAASFSAGTLPVGTSTFTAMYGGDNTFLASGSAAVSYTVTAPGRGTVTSLAATVGTAYVTQTALGNTVLYTATVTAGGSAVQPGQVLFCDARASGCTGAGLLGTAAVMKNGKAMLALRPGLGSHLVKAVFVGTAGYNTSTSQTSTVTVTGVRATSTTLASTGTAGNYTLTATVASSGAAAGPTGPVSFLDTTNANAVVGSAALSAANVVRSFSSTNSAALGAVPAAMVTADFNGDGVPDVATVNGNGTVSILLGGGDGNLTLKSSPTVAGIGKFALVTGDFNADGMTDLAVVSGGASAQLTVLLGKGDGTFTTVAGAAFAGATALVAGDFDGDGILDLAVAAADGTVTTALGAGDGTFVTLASTSAAGVSAAAMAVGDFNGDGTPDLAVTSSSGNVITILLNNGDGTFLPQASTFSTGLAPTKLLAVDLNGDGALDLVSVNSGDGTVSVLLGANNGTFAASTTVAAGASPTDVAAVDLNGDGVPDLVVANGAGLMLLSGDGKGGFAASATSAPTVGSLPVALTVADFNGDGLADVAVANGTGGNVTVALAQIATTETSEISGVAVPGAGMHSVDAMYAGDNTFGASTSAAVALVGLQVTTALRLTTSTAYNSFGQPLTLTATLAPYMVGIGKTDGETVTFLDGKTAIGTGTLTGGVATLTLSTLSVGRHSLTASYAGDSNFIASASQPTVPYRVSAAVAPSVTTLSLQAGGKSVTVISPGTLVTLTATVSGLGQGVTPGTVNFCEATARLCTGAALYGTAQLNGSGVATSRHIFGAGSYQVVARFAGDTSFGISNSATMPLSAPGKTTTAIAVSGTPGAYNLVGTVSSQGSLSSPAGTVAFVDTTNNNTTFASAALAAGTVTQSFATPVATAGVASPQVFGVGDFNGDGIPDVIYANGAAYRGTTSTVGMLLGKADGTYTNTTLLTSTANYSTILVGDFNNDGLLDVLLAGGTNGNNGANATGNLTLLAGKGDGTFTQITLTDPTGGTGFVGGLVGDFDGNGNLDVMLITSNPATYVYNFLMGTGKGTFNLAPGAIAQTSSNGSAVAPVVGDFNRDGLLDILVVAPNAVQFYAGNGDGTFAAMVSSSVSTFGGPYPPAVADFNNDGILDLASTNFTNNTVAILLGNGDGTFSSAGAAANVGPEPTYIVAGDFNGDGNMDIANLDLFDGTISVSLGNGKGVFPTRTYVATVAKPTEINLLDANGDGLPDLLVGSSYGTTVDVHLNTASYVAAATAANIAVPGTGIHYVDATFPGSSAYAASMSGTVPVTATPQVLPAPTAGTSLTLGVNPTTIAVGQPVILTATLSPMSGNVANANGETVNFLNNNLIVGTGTLSNGVATFTTSALPVGRNSLTAAYNGDATFSATVSSPLFFTVTQAATAVSLTVTSGGASVTSVPLNTTVVLQAAVMNNTSALTSGVVRFCDNTYPSCAGQGLLGVAQLTTAGTARLPYRFGAGNHSFNAVFQTQKNFTAGTSRSSVLQVTGGTSTTTLAAAGTQGNYTLTASVTGSGPVVAPTGSVSFNDTTAGSKLLGSASLGAATLSRAYVAGPSLIINADVPSGTVRADFNGDGIPDIATIGSGFSASTLVVLLGKGDGTFQPAINTQLTSTLLSLLNNITAADLNGDGIPDLVLGSALGSGVTVLLGNGDGTFKAPILVSTFNGLFGSSVLTVGDFNGDGIPDILTEYDPSGYGFVQVFLGKGDGTFDNGTFVGGQTVQYQGIVAGDFNGDGKLDAAAINGANSLEVLLGNGDGTFQVNTYTLKNSNGGNTLGQGNLTVGDFNGDGILDLAATTGTNSAVEILLGNGDGTFTEQAATVPATGAIPLTVGDFNGDGLDDLATVKAGAVTLLLSNGDGTFTIQPPVAVVGAGGLVAGDFNGDGQVDIAVANSGTDSIQIVTNTVTETAIAYLTNVALQGAGVHTVNANYSGDMLFAGSTSNTLSLNGFTATATALSLTSNKMAAAYGSTVILTATLAPATGTDGETVTFLSGTTVVGTAMLSGGVATLATPALPGGTDSVTADYSGDKTYGTSTSNAVTITIGQAASSVSYAPPPTQVYGLSAGAAGILNASGTPAGGTYVYTAKPVSGATIAVTMGTVLPAGTYALTVTYTPAGTNYSSSSQTVSGYTVTQATPVITWPTPAPITYGTQLSGTQLDATANVAGTFAYTPNAPAVLPAGAQTLTAVFTPTDSADYTTATARVTLQVNQATPVIMWATPAPVPYGTALTSMQLNATANVAGQFVYSPPAGTVLTAGPHMLTATFTPADTTNYTTAAATVTIQVGAVAATVLYATPAPIVYGTLLSGAQLNATANTPGTFAYMPAAGTLLAAGAQTLTVAFAPTDMVTYSNASASVTLQVAKAPTAVTALASASPINPGSAETLTITVPSITVAAAAPTGSVTVTDNGGAPTTVTLAGGKGSYTTSTLTAGSHTLTVSYGGDVNYLGSSTSVSVTVNAVAPDFTFTATTGLSQTVLPGGSTSFGFALAPTLATYPGAVSFSVSGLPTGATAVLSPASVAAAGGSQSVTMTVATPALHGMQRFGTGADTTVLALLLLPWIGVRRKRARIFSLCSLMLCVSIGLTGCGARSGFFTQPQQTYTLTVTATSGGVQHATDVTLIVQ